MTTTGETRSTRTVRRPATAAMTESGADARRQRRKPVHLDTALALAGRRASQDALAHAYAVAHVDISQVAALAGVSRTALYRLWETQDSFRADLTAYLAAHDDAPWMTTDPGYGTTVVSDDELKAVFRRSFDIAHGDHGTDPRPLLRAGITGYPSAGAPVTAIARRERARLARHAGLLCSALRATERRCVEGIHPLDISIATVWVADGLALAARTSAMEDLYVVGASDDRPWSLLADAAWRLFDGLTERDPHPPSTPVDAYEGRGRSAGPGADPPRGRRLHYLRLAAHLAGREPSGDQAQAGCALGYLGLDALARAEGVTRAAFRRHWPTQSAFGLDLSAHLRCRGREALIDEMVRAGPPAQSPTVDDDALRRLGDRFFDDARDSLSRVSDLTVAPQLLVPQLRARIRTREGPLLEQTAAVLHDRYAVGSQAGPPDRRAAVLLWAFSDGLTRMARTHPDVSLRPITLGGTTHRLPGIALHILLKDSFDLSHAAPPSAVDIRQ